ncbi:hypothetical protein D3C72_1179320 [compost metagenome]
MPSVVKNQSQLRVPPMPWITALPLSANGNCRPEFRMALLLPAAGLPMTMYQGSSYSASLPDIWPIFEVLMVFTASTMRPRSSSISALRSGSLSRTAASAWSSSMSPSLRLAARVRMRRTNHTSSHNSSSTTKMPTAQIAPTSSVCAPSSRNAPSAMAPITDKVRGSARKLKNRRIEVSGIGPV